MHTDKPMTVQSDSDCGVKYLDKMVHDKVIERIPTLNYTQKITLKDICGVELWDQFEEGDQRAAGNYMKKWVIEKKVSMIYSGKNASNSRTYQRYDHP